MTPVQAAALDALLTKARTLRYCWQRRDQMIAADTWETEAGFRFYERIYNAEQRFLVALAAYEAGK